LDNQEVNSFMKEKQTG